MDIKLLKTDESRVAYMIFRDYLSGTDEQVLDEIIRKMKDIAVLNSQGVFTLSKALLVDIGLEINVETRKLLSQQVLTIRFLSDENLPDENNKIRIQLVRRLIEFYSKYSPVASDSENADVTAAIQKHFKTIKKITDYLMGEVHKDERPELLVELARAHLAMANWYRRLEDYENVDEQTEAALEDMCGQHSDVLFDITRTRGVALWRLGRHKEAKTAFEGCLKLAESGLFKGKEQKKRIQQAAGSLGNVLVDLGEHNDAVKNLLKSLIMIQDLGTPTDLCMAYNNVGTAYDDMDDSEYAQLDEKFKAEGTKWRDAIHYYELGIKVAGKPSEGDKAANDSLCRILANAARAYAQSGAANCQPQAYKLLTHADEIYKKGLTLGSHELKSIILYGWGIHYYVRGKERHGDAEKRFKDSLKELEGTGALDYKARSHEFLGILYEKKGQLGNAKDAYQEALELYQKTHQARRIAKLKTTLDRLG
ncbi:MAG: tetratricopeptide repeat protein [archaeon]